MTCPVSRIVLSWIILTWTESGYTFGFFFFLCLYFTSGWRPIGSTIQLWGTIGLMPCSQGYNTSSEFLILHRHNITAILFCQFSGQPHPNVPGPYECRAHTVNWSFRRNGQLKVDRIVNLDPIMNPYVVRILSFYHLYSAPNNKLSDNGAEQILLPQYQN